MMSDSEATARIKINALLAAAGCFCPCPQVANGFLLFGDWHTQRQQ